MCNLINSSIILLDATAKSPMQWQSPRKTALAEIAKGKKILWLLDFGLFQRLDHPLSNPAQFLTFRLGLEHFRDTLWEEFQKYSLGLSLYKGTPDFSLHFNWDEEQKANYQAWLQEEELETNSLYEKMFCRDVSAAYIAQLVENVPDRIPSYLIFEQGDIDPFLELLLTSPDSYPRCKFLFSDKNEQSNDAPLAICLPLTGKKNLLGFKLLADAINKLQQSFIPYKIISESNLTQGWHGLDHIIYSPTSTSASGVRKLRGFLAAGGTLVTVGEFLGFPQEISFESFITESL